MNFTIFLCGACGEHVFPSRRLCPACGARDWRAVEAGEGLVEDSTVLRHRLGASAPVALHLATVVLRQGPRALAMLDEALLSGTPVRLHLEGGGALRALRREGDSAA